MPSNGCRLDPVVLKSRSCCCATARRLKLGSAAPVLTSSPLPLTAATFLHDEHTQSQTALQPERFEAGPRLLESAPSQIAAFSTAAAAVSTAAFRCHLFCSLPTLPLAPSWCICRAAASVSLPVAELIQPVRPGGSQKDQSLIRFDEKDTVPKA